MILMWLVDNILDSGAGVLRDEYTMVWFPGDDLFAALRPRGLPIGNLTSQFWSNCYLDPLDHFVKRELRCAAYLRYVDDFAPCLVTASESCGTGNRRLSSGWPRLRLIVHPEGAVFPVTHGIPWLGFIVYPSSPPREGPQCAPF